MSKRGGIGRKEITSFIKPNINIFHRKRLDNLLALKLNDVLKRKNPYLFKAKNIATAQDLIKSILDAHLSSQKKAYLEVSWNNWQFL